jgi:hypothetical protein
MPSEYKRALLSIKLTEREVQKITLVVNQDLPLFEGEQKMVIG